MTNETIMMIGIPAIVFCIVLLAVAIFVFTRRVIKAMDIMWKKQIAAWKEIDEAQELMMGFMLEFAKVQAQTIQDIQEKVAAGGNGDTPAGSGKKGGLTKGSQEAKDRMAQIRPKGPEKGSQEAKDKMAKVRQGKGKKE